MGANRFLDFMLRHSDFLKDFKLGLVSLPFGNLLVVNHQSSCQDEGDGEKNTDEEEATVEGVHDFLCHEAELEGNVIGLLILQCLV